MSDPHLLHLKALFDLSQKQVVDVGAGTGAFACAMAAEGAKVMALEPNPHETTAIDGVTWHAGTAETLPLADTSVDLVCFIFSLHHVPLSEHQQALNEALRVLRPEGRLHIVEPEVHGAMTEVLKFVEDETHVRQATAKNINDFADRSTITRLYDVTYEVTRRFRDFEGFVDRVTGVSPERRAKLPTVRREMQEAFFAFAEQEDGDLILRQPCTAWHFQSG